MFDFRFSKVVGIVRKNSNYLVVPYNNNNNDRLTAFDPGQPG